MNVAIYGQNNEANGIEIIDLSQIQIRLMNKFENESIEKRSSILIDSIYKPYQYLWSGYLGDESDFTDWLNNIAFKELPSYNKKAENINLKKLNKYFFKTVDSMQAFTKQESRGKWYIFFGPKWTNLGGFSDGTMLIDLAHASNNSLEEIAAFFPHEINHQIYSNNNTQDENAVLYRILDEGFACYVGHLFHNGKTTIADELYYSELEYKTCIQSEEELIKLLKKHYKSNDEKISSSFADRGYQFSEKYPGAIGYYIGFRIVEEFVRRNGKDSWQKIYKMSPEKVLRKNRILK